LAKNILKFIVTGIVAGVLLGWLLSLVSGNIFVVFLDRMRQPSVGGTSRMNREIHVRICERLGVKLPGPTRRREQSRSLLRSQNPPRLGYQSVSDTWGLAKVVRKVEFKLLQLNHARFWGRSKPDFSPRAVSAMPERWAGRSSKSHPLK